MKYILEVSTFLFIGIHFFLHDHFCFTGRMFNPTNTFSSFERSPIILRIGSGTFRTKVGMANIWSPSANWGCTNKSITSIIYWPCKCSSQYFLRLLSAVTDFAVLPATYNLNSYFLSLFLGLIIFIYFLLIF